MISNIHILAFIIVLFETNNALPRYRRQENPVENRDQRSYRPNQPSGSIPGTYYYGVGSDPNYGSFIQRPNSANAGGVLPISYNPNSNLNDYLVNPSHQRQQQQNYLYGNNKNNPWQRPNTNNYYNQPSNRYAPGSQGWYATGGNYWYNNGQSLIIYPCLLILNILILLICKY